MIVYKFPIAFPEGSACVPTGAKLLSIQQQDGHFMAWFLCGGRRNSNTHTIRRFKVVGTGHEFAAQGENHKELKHVTTLQDGQLVWHVFELIPKEQP